MSHAHDHQRAGHSHSHAPSADADRRKLLLALAIIASFMGVEVAAGLIADSVALLSNAAHMLTDAVAIGLALVAARLAARPSSGTFTFGLKRAEILSAQINGASLLVLGAILGYESIGRLSDPPEVGGALVIVVGVIGALANVGAAWALASAERKSLNIEGARAHVLADLYGSLAAIAGGVAVVAAGFDRADAIAALVVVALMFRSGWALLRDASRVLLEATPKGMDSVQIGRAMSEQPGICEMHDLHVWEVTSGFPALSAHVHRSRRRRVRLLPPRVLPDIRDWRLARRDVRRRPGAHQRRHQLRGVHADPQRPPDRLRRACGPQSGSRPRTAVELAGARAIRLT